MSNLSCYKSLQKSLVFQILKADTESKSDVSGTWCGAIDPSGQYVIVRQVVSSGPKRGELQKVKPGTKFLSALVINQVSYEKAQPVSS